jgi:MFS family permease
VSGCSLIVLSTVHQVWAIYALAALSGCGGLGGGVGSLLTQVSVAKWFVARRGQALAIATIGLGIGTIILIPITQWLIGSVGWRSSWLIFGASILVIVIPVSQFAMREAPDAAPVRRVPVSTVRQQPVATSSLPPEADWTPAQALRTPALWFAIAGLALMGFASSGVLTYRVSVWQNQGVSSTFVGLGSMVEPLTFTVGALVLGTIAPRLSLRVLGLVAGAGFALGMLPLSLTASLAVMVFIYTTSSGLSASCNMTVNNLIWPNYFGRRFLGTIRGVVLPISVAATGLGPPVFGYLLDSGLGTNKVWMIAAALFVLSGALLLQARRPLLLERHATPALAALEPEVE